MDSFQNDWILIIIAAIVNIVIGMVWYSKALFGHTWAKLSEMREKDMKPKPEMMVYGFINSLVIAYFLSFFEGNLGVTAVTDGMLIGFLIWLGFVATTQIGCVIWCKKPFKLFAIDTGAKLVSFVIMGGIIAA